MAHFKIRTFKSINKIDKDIDIEFLIDRYIKNKKIIEGISAEFNLIPIFVWQPIQGYKQEQKYHLFSKGCSKIHYSGYTKMQKFETLLGNNFFMCNIQEGIEKSLYVDNVHYNSEISSI